MASEDFNYVRTRPRTIISRCPSTRLSNFPAGGRWDFSRICPTGVNGNLWGIDFNWNFDHFSPLNGGTYIQVELPHRFAGVPGFNFPTILTRRAGSEITFTHQPTELEHACKHAIRRHSTAVVVVESPKKCAHTCLVKKKKILNNNRPTTVPTLLTCSLHDMWALISRQLSHPHTPFTSATHTHFGPNETRVWHIPQIGWSLCGD